VLTVFAVPKPFLGHIGLIQYNAVRSWRRLHPECQVILCGDEPGCGEAARELGVDRIPDVDTNEFGTPLLSSVFERVELQASHDLLCYANADIIFFDDLLDAVRAVAAAYSRFLAIGEARCLDVARAVSFADADVVELQTLARQVGALRGRLWIDFFVFPRGSFGRLPDFALGRPSWDNWMIWRARRLRMPVVDVTAATTVVHQSHDYAHVQQARGSRWEGPEGDSNFALLRWEERRFTLDDATHHVTLDGLARTSMSFQHRVRTELVLHDRTVPLARLLERGYRQIRALSRAA
jgi:hypothetical protein